MYAQLPGALAAFTKSGASAAEDRFDIHHRYESDFFRSVIIYGKVSSEAATKALLTVWLQPTPDSIIKMAKDTIGKWNEISAAGQVELIQEAVGKWQCAGVDQTALSFAKNALRNNVKEIQHTLWWLNTSLVCVRDIPERIVQWFDG